MKAFIMILLIGLMIATTACSSNNASTGTTAAANNANTGNNAANTAAANNVNSGNTDVKAVNTVEANVQRIADIKTDSLLGKTVTVQGVVVNNLKTAGLSGYRLKDASDSIPISAQVLPKVNTTVTVTGTLSKGAYFGYYILATE
jgi:RecJ-like exonuclease